MVNVFSFNTAATISGMIDATKGTATNVLGGVITVLGLILLFYGAFTIFKALTSQQGGGATAWMKAALCIVIGGFMLNDGIKTFTNVASTGQDTISGIANGNSQSVIHPTSLDAPVTVHANK